MSQFWRFAPGPGDDVTKEQVQAYFDQDNRIYDRRRMQDWPVHPYANWRERRLVEVAMAAENLRGNSDNYTHRVGKVDVYHRKYAPLYTKTANTPWAKAPPPATATAPPAHQSKSWCPDKSITTFAGN